jgi:hypothetical protein
LVNIPAAPTVRANMAQNAATGTYYAFSAHLACALSTKYCAGLGTLGISVPVAEKMLITGDGGFENVEVLLEEGGSRCFVVT